jgi:hypothetical protein
VKGGNSAIALPGHWGTCGMRLCSAARLVTVSWHRVNADDRDLHVHVKVLIVQEELDDVLISSMLPNFLFCEYETMI